MSSATIVIALVIVGILLWILNACVPMDVKIKNILNVVVVVIVVLWLLSAFGVWDQLRNMRASIQSPSFGPSARTLVAQSGAATSPAVVR